MQANWRRTCELYLHVFYGIESLLEMGQNLEFWGSNPRFEPQKRGKDQHPPQEHSTELCVAYRGLEMLRRLSVTILWKDFYKGRVVAPFVVYTLLSEELA